MAHGKTLELRAFDTQIEFSRLEEGNWWMQKDRDRSLRGKARIRARKKARRG